MLSTIQVLKMYPGLSYSGLLEIADEIGVQKFGSAYVWGEVDLDALDDLLDEEGEEDEDEEDDDDGEEADEDDDDLDDDMDDDEDDGSEPAFR